MSVHPLRVKSKEFESGSGLGDEATFVYIIFVNFCRVHLVQRGQIHKTHKVNLSTEGVSIADSGKHWPILKHY